GRQRLRRRAAGHGGGGARPVDGLAGRRTRRRGDRNEGGRGGSAPGGAGSEGGPCYGRIPWIDRLEHVISAFFTTPSRPTMSSSPAALYPLSPMDSRRR